MKNMAKTRKIKKANKGITLITLVVTIIILLILAGITIAGITGEKGLIKEAKTAKELTELKALEEQIELAIIKAEQKHRNPGMDDVIAELKNNKVISKDDQVNKETGAVHTDAGYLIEGKLDDYIGKTSTGNNTGDGNATGNNTGDGNTTGNNTGNNTGDGNTTGGGDTPTPPVNNNAVPGEIVTGDENKEYTKNGTATIPAGFAIVPGLDDVSEGLVISDVANDTENQGNQFVWIPVTEETKYKRNENYELSFFAKTGYDDVGYLPEGITNEEQAVKNAGGFYIARYEAGKEGTNTLISKKGATVWDNISQGNAKSTSKTMFSNNPHIKSALISGIQWDLTMDFIASKPRTDVNGKTYDVKVYEPSRRVNNLGKYVTGNNEADKVCNIYDLESDAYEYVADKCIEGGKHYFVYRGSVFNVTAPASQRNRIGGGAGTGMTFRVALYVI